MKIEYKVTPDKFIITKTMTEEEHMDEILNSDEFFDLVVEADFEDVKNFIKKHFTTK